MTDIKKESCVAELVNLLELGCTPENVIRTAYCQGKVDGLQAAFNVQAGRSQAEQEAIDRNNEVVMKNLDRWHEFRGGCFEEN